MSQNYEIQMCALICFYLSGSLRRGLEFTTDKSGQSTFTLFVETSPNPLEQKLQSTIDYGPIKVIGQQKYFETSLSLFLAQAQDSSGIRSNYQQEEDKYFTLSQLSKQLSIKPSEMPLDLQSAYFSQISKIRADSSSKVHLNSNSQYRFFNNQPSFDNQLQAQQKNKPKASKNSSDNTFLNNSDQMQSFLDFGDSTLNLMKPPEIIPKLLNSVIKYKITNSCCSKVLIVDNDYFSSFTLNCLLANWDIKVDKAYNGKQALEMIQYKSGKQCFCGNKSYLIIFLEINLPVKFINGLELVRLIRELTNQQIIDRSLAIASTNFVDMNIKLECYRNGIEYFLPKPLDIFELEVIIQSLSI